jgi:hypothetical protein
VANKITLNPQDSITLLPLDNNITLPQGRITLKKLFCLLYNLQRGNTDVALPLFMSLTNLLYATVPFFVFKGFP